MGTAASVPPGPLRCALLGLLNRRPLTGYEILKRFNRSIVFFWHAKRSQIYAELKRMEGLGLVTSRVTPQTGRPDKRAYAITQAGLAVLRGWLDRPAAVGPIKDEILLRTFFSDRLSSARAAADLRRQAREHQRVVEEFEGIRAALRARYGPLESSDDRALFFGYLVLEQGIRFERMYGEWCEWAAAAVQARRSQASRPAVDPVAADFIMTS
ncbi:MAG TPA: PadR family transcriptional regulator [Methylomirabilota bacterium]|nr:PadR family transcriptional regulator [Methylomirabilota bacterium]